MPKIIITQNLDLYPDQIERIKKLGNTTIYTNLAKSPEEWLERCQGANIICTGKFGLKTKIYELSNVFISLPFVAIGWIDLVKLKERNINVANSPGCNKDAVSEWIIAMMINIMRDLIHYTNVTNLSSQEIPRTPGLTNKKVVILGKGNIGSRVGKICETCNMKVEYFLQDDNLTKKIQNSDIIINCLSSNPTTQNLLDYRFFQSLKVGSYFISPTDAKVYDTNALIEALDQNILAGAAIDAGGVQVGNYNDPYYQKLINHPKILATPHIAYNTDITARVANDMMIDNIEAWIKGTPKNLI